MISALEVLCKYKGRYTKFFRGFDPVYISFLNKDNILYSILVSDKQNEKGVLKLLRVESPMLNKADKYILLFRDDLCLNEVECNVPYIYCLYPDLTILTKSN